MTAEMPTFAGAVLLGGIVWRETTIDGPDLIGPVVRSPS